SVRKLLAILASQQHRSGGRHCARFETAKPAVRERQPVAALGELTLVDDVDANPALLIDNPAYGVAQALLVLRHRVETRRSRQASYMRRLNRDISHRVLRVSFHELEE